MVGTIGFKAGGIVILVIVETVQIKPALVSPILGILVAEHHDGAVAAVILVYAEGRFNIGRYSEEFLKVHTGTFPVSPGVTEFVDTLHAHVTLDGVLCSPDTAAGDPLPGEEVFTGCLEDGGLHTEHILVVGGKAAAGILNDIQGIGLCLFKIGLGFLGRDGAVNAGLCEVYLCEETHRGILVNAVVFADIGILGKEFDGLFKGDDDVIVDIGLLHLELLVITGVLDGGSVVVDDGNVTEGTDKEEISHSLPGEGLADCLVLCFLACGTGRVTDVVDDGVALRVHGPKGIGHILEVRVSTVNSKGRVGVVALIDVTAHSFRSVDVETDDIVPGRIVEVVDGLLHLHVVLIVVGSCVSVFCRTVQEFGAGSGH